MCCPQQPHRETARYMPAYWPLESRVLGFSMTPASGITLVKPALIVELIRDFSKGVWPCDAMQVLRVQASVPLGPDRSSAIGTIACRLAQQVGCSAKVERQVLVVA